VRYHHEQRNGLPVRHFLIGKKIFCRNNSSREGTSICSVVWIGIRLVRDQRAHHRGRNVCPVHPFASNAAEEICFARGLHSHDD